MLIRVLSYPFPLLFGFILPPCPFILFQSPAASLSFFRPIPVSGTTSRYVQSDRRIVGQWESPRGRCCSALVYEGMIIHLVFLSLEEEKQVEPISSYRRRRGFRRPLTSDGPIE